MSILTCTVVHLTGAFYAFFSLSPCLFSSLLLPSEHPFVDLRSCADFPHHTLSRVPLAHGLISICLYSHLPPSSGIPLLTIGADIQSLLKSCCPKLFSRFLILQEDSLKGLLCTDVLHLTSAALSISVLSAPQASPNTLQLTPLSPGFPLQ